MQSLFFESHRTLTIRSDVTGLWGLHAATTVPLLEGADDLAKLHQLLESTELRARTDEVANLFYANFGKPQFWPVLDALWNLDDGKFPHYWSAIQQPIVRLTIAGLRANGLAESFGHLIMCNWQHSMFVPKSPRAISNPDSKR